MLLPKDATLALPCFLLPKLKFSLRQTRRHVPIAALFSVQAGMLHPEALCLLPRPTKRLFSPICSTAMMLIRIAKQRRSKQHPMRFTLIAPIKRLMKSYPLFVHVHSHIWIAPPQLRALLHSLHLPGMLPQAQLQLRHQLQHLQHLQHLQRTLSAIRGFTRTQ